MKSPIITREKIQIDVSDEVMEFTFKLGTALSALIGIWAVSCLVAGLISLGPLQMVKGYITAITGF
jgi:predicted MarR family transcription regulator